MKNFRVARSPSPHKRFGIIITIAPALGIMAGPREFYRVLFTAALQDGLFRAKKTEAHSFNIASDLWPVATSFTFQFSVSKSS